MLTTLSSLLHVPVDTLVPALWLLGKATTLLLVAMGITVVMRRTSAVSRHLVWFASLAAVLLIPIVVAVSPVSLPILPGVLQQDAAVATSPTNNGENASGRILSIDQRGGDVMVLSQSTSTSTTVRTITNGVPEVTKDDSRSSSWLGTWNASVSTWLLITWLAIAALLTGWLAVGLFTVARIVRRAEPLTEAEWTTPLFEIADRLSLDDAPRLVASDAIAMPFACGLRTPTIVLPASSATWSAEQRTAVLLHEMAHIKRRDIVGHTVGRFACALYWFHPLVWTAAKRLRAESERACDDLALLCGARPSDYAEHLLDIVARVKHNTTPSVALAMATRSEFEGRMLAILDPALRRVAPSRKQSWSLVASVAMVAVVIGISAPVSSVAATAPDRLQMAMDENALPDRSLSDGASFDTTWKGTPNPVPTPNPTPTPTPAPTPNPARAALPSALSELASIAEPASPVSPVSPRSQRLEQFANSIGAAAMQAASFGLRSAAIALGSPELQRAFGYTRDSAERTLLLANVLRTDKSPDLRRIAAWGLSESASQTTGLLALTAALSRDESARVREMAAWALADSRDDARAIDALIGAVQSDRSSEVRSTAIWALGNLNAEGDSRAIAAIADALTSSDPSVREIAAWSLGSIAPDKAPAALLQAVGDGDVAVRITAAWALYQIGDERAVPALDRALRREKDRNAQLAQVRALSNLGDPAIDALKRLVDDPDEELRSTAIRALAGGGTTFVWPAPRPRPRPTP